MSLAEPLRMSFSIPAHKNERFMEHCFDRSIGTTIDIHGFGMCLITDARVIEEGTVVLFTVEKTLGD